MTTLFRQALLRRDLKANLPTLGVGEPFFCTDTHEFFIGSAGGNVKIDIGYSPASPSFWAGTAPNNLISATDRLASAVHTLLGGTIP